MNLINQILANITLLLSFMLFAIVFLRLLRNKKRSFDHILDGLLAMGFSGIVIIILCTKAYQADLPMILILVVLIIKYLKCHSGNEVQL